MKNIERTIKTIRNLIEKAPEKREVRLTYSVRKNFEGSIEIKDRGIRDYDYKTNHRNIVKERKRQIHITVPVDRKGYDTSEYYYNLMFK